MIDNRNLNSATITDFRIEFNFKNIIAEAKPIPLLDHGGMIVGGIRIYEEKQDGTEFRHEEQPVETSITKHFSLSIQQVKVDGKNVNTNILLFNCDKWPEKASFAADIIVDLSKEPEFRIKPDKVETYEGIYIYEIGGQRFSQAVRGSMPSD
jgi:hypothetical protein